jgi:alpha-glucosidase
VDGFVLDLQPGISPGSDNSNMGRVAWDLTHFPDPQTKLANYQANEGIGIIVIEESTWRAGGARDLASRGFLARAGCATCAPVYLTGNPWWGKGGMIDWTQDAAGDYWHDLKRQPLIADGVIGHWIDLGEPEMYDPNDWTAGVLQAVWRGAASCKETRAGSHQEQSDQLTNIRRCLRLSASSACMGSHDARACFSPTRAIGV